MSDSTPHLSFELSPRSDDHEPESVRRIVRAAAACFGRLGFKGASMTAIAAEAGVSKSLVLYHFQSKEQLFVEAQLQTLRAVLDRIRQFAPADSSAAGLATAFDEVMSFVWSELPNLRVMIELHNAAATNPAMAAHLEAFNAEVDRLAVRGLEALLGASAAEFVVPIDRAVRLFRTLFNGLILELTCAPDEAARDRVRETFADAKVLLARATLRDPVVRSPITGGRA